MTPLLAAQTAAEWRDTGGAVLLTLVAGGFLLFTSVMTCRPVVPDRADRGSAEDSERIR